MNRYATACLASIAVLGAALPASAQDAGRVYFAGIDDKSIYVEVVGDQGARKALRVAGVVLAPQTQEYVDSLEDGYLSGFLSPDGARILVSLGHIDEKNLWVVNLKASKLEFESHDNAGRHVLPKWLGATRFELVYGGMGYRVERWYELQGESWTLIRDKTFTEE